MAPEELSEIRTLDQALTIIRVLLTRIIALENEVARLKKDLSTSSKPPSSDIVKPKSEQRQPGVRKIGGQPGHKSINHTPLPSEEADVTVPYVVEHCPDCGTILKVDPDVEQFEHQFIELKEKPTLVAEHRFFGCRCRKCRVVHYVDSTLNEGQLLGTRLQALVAYMKGNLGVSYTELKDLFQDVLGTPVSRGMLCQVVKRASEVLRIPYQEIEHQYHLKLLSTLMRRAGVTESCTCNSQDLRTKITL